MAYFQHESSFCSFIFLSMLLLKVVDPMISHIGAKAGFDSNIDSYPDSSFITVAVGTGLSCSGSSVYFRENLLPLWK